MILGLMVGFTAAGRTLILLQYSLLYVRFGMGNWVHVMLFSMLWQREYISFARNRNMFGIGVVSWVS